VSLPAARRRIAVAVIFVTIVIDLAAFSIPIPVLPAFLERFSPRAYHVPLVTAMYPLALVLFVALWGWISDRIGRRPVLLLSLLGTAGSFMLLALAPNLVIVYVARLLSGFFGASIGTAQAYITDLTDSQNRAEGMGLVGAASGLGLVMGTALGGVLAGVDINLPFYASALVAGANFVLAALILPESRAATHTAVGWRGLRRALIPAPFLVVGDAHDARTRIFLLIFLLVFFAFSALEAMFPLYAKLRFSWSETQIGLFMGLAFGAVLVATQWLLIGRLARIAGEVGLTIIGLALLAAGTLGVSLAYSTPLLTVTTVLLAIGAGLAFPAFTSLFSRVCGAHEAGEVLSQSQAMVHMGRTLGALCWGWVLHTLGTGAPFVVSALATLGALAIFVLAGRILLPR
jgi:MFS family permease